MQVAAKIANTHRNLRQILNELDVDAESMSVRHFVELLEYFSYRPKEYEEFIKTKGW